jgi:hypothetical protein
MAPVLAYDNMVLCVLSLNSANYVPSASIEKLGLRQLMIIQNET